MVYLRSMRLLSNGLVIPSCVLVGALLAGCSSDSRVIRMCESSKTRSLDLSSQSALGFSGAQLKEQVVGDYQLTATKQDKTEFALTLSVTSNADRAEETDAGESSSLACPSTLKIQAHFELAGEAGELEGAWDGLVVGSRSSAEPEGVAARGEATVARASFASLPSESRAKSYSFSTSLPTADISGSLAELVDSGGGGQTHPTENSLILATWGDQGQK
jgi:hypothetical protein